MKRTKGLKIKRTKYSSLEYKVGNLISVKRKVYFKMLKKLGLGAFHMIEAIDFMTFKIMNKKVRNWLNNYYNGKSKRKNINSTSG